MFKHVKVAVILILAFCLGLSTLLLAGTTGKISGRITDASSGDPLMGVNVIITGTNMGAATDARVITLSSMYRLGPIP